MDCCGGILPLPKIGYSPGSEGDILSGAQDWTYSLAYVYCDYCFYACILLLGIDYVSFQEK